LLVAAVSAHTAQGMAQRFVRCQLCGIPHPANAEECPVYRKPIVPASQMGSGASRPSAPPPAPGLAQPASPLRAPSGAVQIHDAPKPASVPGAPLVGRVLADRYRVQGVIASGGMGVVYDAIQVTLGRRVAIKCLHARYATDQVAVARFQHEAVIAGSFGHPNIVEVFDMGWVDDDRVRTPFLVMELLEGETVTDCLKRERRLKLSLAVTIALQTLSALVATHAKNILHRDLKPDNLFLVRGDGSSGVRVKVLDYGVSKPLAIDAAAMRLTRAGYVMGTPSYMAPEQAMGDVELDVRVDIYSLGMILYEVITGRLPYQARTPVALIAELQRVTPPSPRLLRPEVPAALDAIVMRAIAREREQRFPDAVSMQRALVALGRLDEPDPEVAEDPTEVVEMPHESYEESETTQPVKVFARRED